MSLDPAAEAKLALTAISGVIKPNTGKLRLERKKYPDVSRAGELLAVAHLTWWCCVRFATNFGRG
ncbi:MAG: hypothetical protein O7E57_07765 [Gammaproteobacteria bacterium]|nr:hypothetical protein [Gammaproteobacteria bacterium]